MVTENPSLFSQDFESFEIPKIKMTLNGSVARAELPPSIQDENDPNFPFACASCDKNFSRRDYLDNHMITHGVSENTNNNPDVDDEDELLYGESAPSLFDKAAHEAKDNSDDTGTKSWKKYLKTPKVTYWTIAVKENGNLEVMSLPDFSVKFLVQNFNLANSVLTDTLFTTSTPKTMPAAAVDIENVPKITEIQMVGLGDRQRRPLLLARTVDHELIMYEGMYVFRNFTKRPIS